MFYIALSVQMYRLTHSPAARGLIGIARFAPTLLLSLPGGVLADAHNRKRILYVTQPLIALCSLLLALATYTQTVTPALMYLLTAVVAAAVATIIFGISRDYPLSLLALALVGASDTLGMVIRQNIHQLATPDALRGRLSSIYMVSFMGGQELGALEAGLLTSAIGAPLTVVLGGVATLGIVSITSLVAPALRRYRSSTEAMAEDTA